MLYKCATAGSPYLNCALQVNFSNVTSRIALGSWLPLGRLSLVGFEALTEVQVHIKKNYGRNLAINAFVRYHEDNENLARLARLYHALHIRTHIQVITVR